MFDQFQDLEDRYLDIERRISDPEVISDQTQYQDLVKRHAELEDAVMAFRRSKKLRAELAEAQVLLKDPDMKEMAAEELPELEEQLPTLEHAVRISLLPKDAADEKNDITLESVS